MKKAERYRTILRELGDWEEFLLGESGLPGPRANLELVQAVADEGHEELFNRLLAYDPQKAPTNSAYEFMPVCGVVGLGRLVAEGRSDLLPILRRYASDPRWRIREAVAMALQRLGDADMDSLLGVAAEWSRGTMLEQRAAIAAVCEPRLLKEAAHARCVLRILDEVTRSVSDCRDRRDTDFRVLRQALGYCWSVAVAALPDEGRPMMECWLGSDDKDVQWITRENLKKKRLATFWKKEVAAQPSL